MSKQVHNKHIINNEYQYYDLVLDLKSFSLSGAYYEIRVNIPKQTNTERFLQLKCVQNLSVHLFEVDRAVH